MLLDSRRQKLGGVIGSSLEVRPHRRRRSGHASTAATISRTSTSSIRSCGWRSPCRASGVELDPKTLDALDTDKDGRVRAPEVREAVRFACAAFKDPGDLLNGGDESIALKALADGTGRPPPRASSRTWASAERRRISLADVADTARDLRRHALQRRRHRARRRRRRRADAQAHRRHHRRRTARSPIAAASRASIRRRVDAFFDEVQALRRLERRGGGAAIASRSAQQHRAPATRCARCAPRWTTTSRAAGWPRSTGAPRRCSPAARPSWRRSAAHELSPSSPRSRACRCPRSRRAARCRSATASTRRGRRRWRTSQRRGRADPRRRAEALAEAEWNALQARLAPLRGVARDEAGDRRREARARRGCASSARATARRASDRADRARRRARAGERADRRVERLLLSPARPRRAAQQLRQLLRLLRAQGRGLPGRDALPRRARAATCACESTTPRKHAVAGRAVGRLPRLLRLHAPRRREDDHRRGVHRRRLRQPDGRPQRRSSTIARAATGTRRSPRSIENPISIRQAFWSPYKKLVRMIEEQVAKRAAAADAEAEAQAEAASPKPPPPPTRTSPSPSPSDEEDRRRHRGRDRRRRRRHRRDGLRASWRRSSASASGCRSACWRLMLMISGPSMLIA